MKKETPASTIELFTIKVTANDLKRSAEHPAIWSPVTEQKNPLTLALLRSTNQKWLANPRTMTPLEHPEISFATPGSMAIFLHEWLLRRPQNPKQFRLVRSLLFPDPHLTRPSNGQSLIQPPLPSR